MLPMKDTSSTNAKLSIAGKAMPVATAKMAPASNRLRNSKRGAIIPTASVRIAVPNSDAVATRPICGAVKPMAER